MLPAQFLLIGNVTFGRGSLTRKSLEFSLAACSSDKRELSTVLPFWTEVAFGLSRVIMGEGVGYCALSNGKGYEG